MERSSSSKPPNLHVLVKMVDHALTYVFCCNSELLRRIQTQKYSSLIHCEFMLKVLENLPASFFSTFIRESLTFK